jgi:hypothetical protein
MHIGEHAEREVGADEARTGDFGGEDARVAAFAGAGVGDEGVGEGGEFADEEADVLDAGVDGGGEVLLVAGGVLEGGADLAGEPGRQRRGGRFSAPPEETLEEVHGLVRKMGRPSLLL